MIKLVIIGYGQIAKSHKKALEAVGFQIIGACNRTDHSNQRTLDDGISKVYTDYHKMIIDLKPEAILIAVSSKHIYNVSSEVIPYSIPILIEKPTGNSLIEHNKLIKLSKKHQTPVMVGVNRRHYSLFEKVFKLIEGKENITSVLIEWSESPKKLELRGYSNQEIADVIFGNSIHGIDMLCWLVGDVKKPTIFTKNLGNFRWLMNASGISKKGVIYNFNSSWDCPVPWRVVLYSKDKRFVLAPLESLEYIDNKWSKTNISPENFDLEFKAGFYKQAITFKELVTSGINDKASLESVTNSMELCQLFYNEFYKK
jgi:predicted dehydrogenase